MGLQIVGGAPKAAGSPPPNGVWRLPDGRVWDGAGYVDPAVAAANNQAVSQAYAAPSSDSPGTSFLDPAIDYVKKAAPTNWKEAGYLIGNPIGYGLDTFGVGPDAGIGAKTGGRLGIPGARDVYDPLNLPGVDPVKFAAPTVAPPPKAPAAPAVGTAGASMPIAGTPSFDAANQAATDIMAGIKADYDASKQPRPAPQVGPQAPVSTVDASAGTLGRAAPIGAITAAPTTLERAAPITDTTVDRTQSDQTRGQQEVSLEGLRAAAEGRVPSAAELQLRQATDSNIKKQYALAAALQGRSAGGALKSAEDAAGELNAQAAADASVLRANEQAAARRAEIDALTGVRTGDISVAGKQADVTFGTKKQNQDVDVTQNRTTADLDKGNKEFNATQTQGADVQNQNADVTQNATEYRTEADIAKGNADRTVDVAKFDAQQRQALAISNADLTMRQQGLDDASRTAVLNALLVAQGHQIQGLSAQAAAVQAQGVLQLARDQFNKSSSQADRAYWTNVIGTLLQAATAGYGWLGKNGGGSGGIPNISGGGGGNDLISSSNYGNADVDGSYGELSDPYGDGSGIPDGGT